MKLIILDFTTGEVDIYPLAYDYESDIDADMNGLLKSLGHNVNTCQWMFTEGNIIFHKEILK